MALDRAVQCLVESGDAPPTLRLYRWVRPTVTLGRFQAVSGIDLSYCADSGIDVVRRFTGGRGVLHDEELTYCVVARIEDGIPRGVAASYRRLSTVLAEAYRRLGVSASLTERDIVRSESSACYLATTRADLAAGAAKLSGSAQVWHGRTVMQHGSFTVGRDLTREARVFLLSEGQRHELARHTLTLEDALGVRPDVETLTHAVVGAFRDELAEDLRPGEFSDEELRLARSLLPEVSVTQK